VKIYGPRPFSQVADNASHIPFWLPRNEDMEEKFYGKEVLNDKEGNTTF
jgi:hypothetical protein